MNEPLTFVIFVHFYSGRKFDKDGNLLQWWDKDVIEKFNEAKQCFIDQYGSYVVPQLNRTVSSTFTVCQPYLIKH